MGKRYVGDIETNGFLEEMDRIHCIVLYDLDTEKYLRFNDQPQVVSNGFEKNGTIADAVHLMNEAESLFFHNGHSFDYLALKWFHPEFDPNPTALMDTLTMAKAVYRDIRGMDFGAMKKNRRHPEFAKMQLVGRHSLKAWGYRLGVLKSSIADEDGTTDWSVWTPEMEDYCEQDVRVTVALLEVLLKEHNLKRHPWHCHQLDNHFQHIMSRQEAHGFFFHEEKAQQLYSEMQAELKRLEQELKDVVRPFYRRGKLFTPKRDNRKQGYVAGASLTKIDLTEFNPGSRDHIQDRLQKLYDWKPAAFGADGKATVDESTLSGLDFPIVPKLLDYLVLGKTIGMLASGKQGWLKCVREGRIHGRIDPMGTVTWRCSHSHPNLGQVPSVATDSKTHDVVWGIKGRFGADCRALFGVPGGHTLCGHDGSGLELRCLAHYMGAYDDGDYADVVINGDVHTENQNAIGLNQRGNAKTWIYAFLYGAGDAKLGSIFRADMTPEQWASWKADYVSKLKKGQAFEMDAALAKLGADSRARIAKNLPALSKLVSAVKKKARERGRLRALDGRELVVRSAHSALNTVLQSAGALVMKRWLVILDAALQEAGMVPYEWRYKGADGPSGDYEFVANVHDEAQTEVRDEAAPTYDRIAVESFPLAGQYYQFRAPIEGEGKLGQVWTDTH